MTADIVTKLKAGPIANVMPFGGEKLPAPPYVVVKPEPDPLGRGRRFRIIVHARPGQQQFLEDYIFNTLSVLLGEASVQSRHGNHNVLLVEGEYSEIVASNDDGTISMERCFLLPSRIF